MYVDINEFTDDKIMLAMEFDVEIHRGPFRLITPIARSRISVQTYSILSLKNFDKACDLLKVRKKHTQLAFGLEIKTIRKA